MPKIRITELPPTYSMAYTDIFPMVNVAGDGTYKITLQDMATNMTGLSAAAEATTAATATYATSAGTATTATTAATASNVTASNVYGPFGSNSVISASHAASASHALNGGVTSIIAGSGISISSATGNVTITNTGGGGGGSPGGSNTQIQYNNSSTFGGVPTLTYDGSLLKATGSFTGSFTGTLIGTSSWSLYPIGVTGSSLYSTSPITSELSTGNGIFLGSEAGYQASGSYSTVALGLQAAYQATDAANSVFIGSYSGYRAFDGTYSSFIGYRAGWSASNASDSQFIGANAGEYATYANHAVMIGEWAGKYAASGSYSVLLGHRAGEGASISSSIGTNNIIIGTHVTLDENRSDSINLGGIIFATGSYGSPGNFTDLFSGSVGNGMVGINVVLPKYSLDVSGSGNYTNALTVTGSFNVTGSSKILGDTAITGSLVVSGSNGAGIFSQGATLIDYSSGISNTGSYMVWRAPFSCSVVAIYGYYVGGTSPRVNAARSGSSGYGMITGSSFLVDQENVWVAATASALQNSSFNAGDSLQVIMSGSANYQLAVQVDFIRKF